MLNIVLVAILLLPIAAGSFIYIAVADLIPEVFKEKRIIQLIINIIAIIIGILILLSKSKKVLMSLSPMFKGYPKLVTRLDFACCLKKSNKICSNFFVNEIEFNPGLYTHADDNNRFFLDMKIAKQLLKVIKQYKRRRVPFS